MSRLLLVTLVVAAVAGCDATGPITGCPPGALCARETPLIATGTVQASAHPVAGAVVTLTAYRDSCGGTPALLEPVTPTDTTNAAGRYTIAVFPAESVAAACVRVSYSPALYVDTPGVPLRLFVQTTDTLRVNLIGP